jgi:L-cysteine:1D-myo-inositol 2-amino-2-deoxy-alpha-D-glucopyranoside ligase
VRTWPSPEIPVLPGQGGTIRVHDSTTGILVEAAPGHDAGMYVCGITPYDATHIGHAATYLAFDLLLRAWRDAGKLVTYVSNVTDVDDPLLERAADTGVDWRALALEQTALFREDMTALGVVPPDVWDGAVESIPRVVDAVEQMLADGTAYRVPLRDPGAGGARRDLGDVYADLSADQLFGMVSRLDRAQMLALFSERGGDPDTPGKRDPLDPVLWRRERVGEPTWEGASLGTGRPGWHIECAVIARDALGVSFDVQGGGTDLLFPHHEMSASHVRSLSVTARNGAAACAHAHVHAGMVALDGHKMSKSRGNLELVSRLRSTGVDPMAVRLAILAHHYRQDWEWTADDLAAGEARLARWRDAVSGNGGPDASATLGEIRAAVADDLDAPRALRAVDAWCDATGDRDGTWDVGAPGVVARAVDALLGIRF